MKKKYDWHFARPALAESYLDTFSLGLTTARGLFARRRMGKTEFLKQDLMPAAIKQGYQVAYVNLWDLEIDPATTMVAELYKVIEPTGFEKVWDKLIKPIKGFEAKGGVPGIAEASLVTSFDDHKKTVGTLLMEAMHAFDQKKFNLLLVIDEAQVLAYEQNAHFAHALRAALDTRKERIKVIFAGSSEHTLRKMFGVPAEPFYNWAPLEAFELLGDSFVQSMVDQVNSLSKFPLQLNDALEAFKQLNNTPEFFRRYIEQYLIYPMNGPASALSMTKSTVFNDKNFIEQWSILLPADQALLAVIADGIKDLHGEKTLELLTMALGLEQKIGKNTIHNALRRLCAKSIITKIEYGVYQFEDDAFADWIKHRSNKLV